MKLNRTRALKSAWMAFPAFAFLASTSNAAVIADPAADWISSDGVTAGSVVGGTAAGWSYFRATVPNGGTEVALIQSVNTGDVGGPGFAGSNGTGRRLPAVVGDNANGGDYELFGDGSLNNSIPGTDLLIHPGQTGEPVSSDPTVIDSIIVRYTVGPADIAANGSTATVAGSFRNLVSAPTVDVFVYHNNTQLYFGNAANNAFSPADFTVAAGDTIDFVVDQRGSVGSDETALRATISLTPEPSSLLLCGLGGLLGFHRRRG